MLRFSLAVTSLSLALAAPSHADFNADIGLTSEYIKDGISQTQGQIAPQAGLTYFNDLGLYGGAWVSNIDHKGNSAHAEWSGFGGYYFPITEGLAVDLSLTHYGYAGDATLSKSAYDEATARLLINDDWTFGWRQAEDYMGTGEAKRVLESAYTFQTGTFSLEFYLAQNRYLKVNDDVNFGGSRDDYWHFRFGVGRSYDNWDYRLKLERTNLGSGYDAGTNITFSLHRYFDF